MRAYPLLFCLNAQRSRREAINWPMTGSTSARPFDGRITKRLTSLRLGLYRMLRRDECLRSRRMVTRYSDPQKRTESWEVTMRASFAFAAIAMVAQLLASGA